jgi:hypothetical protein
LFPGNNGTAAKNPQTGRHFRPDLQLFPFIIKAYLLSLPTGMCHTARDTTGGCRQFSPGLSLPRAPALLQNPPGIPGKSRWQETHHEGKHIPQREVFAEKDLLCNAYLHSQPRRNRQPDDPGGIAPGSSTDMPPLFRSRPYRKTAEVAARDRTTPPQTGNCPGTGLGRKRDITSL